MSTSFDLRRQRGDMLLESLIGVLLLSALGAGMANVAGRVLNAQHETRIADLAVVEMRRMLQVEGESLCTGASTRTATLGGVAGGPQVEVKVDCGGATPLTIVAANAGIMTVNAPRAVQLSVAAAQLGLDADGPPLTVGTRQ